MCYSLWCNAPPTMLPAEGVVVVVVVVGSSSSSSSSNSKS